MTFSKTSEILVWTICMIIPNHIWLIKILSKIQISVLKTHLACDMLHISGYVVNFHLSNVSFYFYEYVFITSLTYFLNQTKRCFKLILQFILSCMTIRLQHGKANTLLSRNKYDCKSSANCSPRFLREL